MIEEIAPIGEKNTKVALCTCNHPWQDSKYGKNRRLHNRCAGGGVKGIGGRGWRCTVCGVTK